MTSVQYHNNQYYNPNDQRQNNLLPNHPQRPVSIYDNYLVSNFQNGDSNYDQNDEYSNQPNHQFYQAPIVRPEDVEEDDDDADDDDLTNNQYNNRNYKNNCDTSDNNYNQSNEDTDQETSSTKRNLIKNQKNSVRISSNNNLKNKSTSNINNVTSPSLTYCLSTTVPQNLSASKISGRHAPTRNSLRHSRMIVLSRSGRAEKYKRKGLLIRRQGFARILAWIQAVLGFLISMLALWLLLWAPNISPRVNPYWSAAPLLSSGVVGLLLLGCCQQRKYKDARHFCAQSSKILSIFLALVACITCMTAAIFATIHFVTLQQMVCAPEYGLNTTCICRRGAINPNDTSITAYLLSQTTAYYHYIDLSCPEVDPIFNLILLFSAGVNGIAVMFTISYLYIHWKSRNLHNYTSIRTNDNQTSI